MTYEVRRAKLNFATKEIVIRGFARELKYILLKGENQDPKNPEFTRVANALNNLITEKYRNNSEKDKFSYTDLISSSGFSNWWAGKKYPEPENRAKIDLLIPGLLGKWFDRKNFKNRMQLHLASLDIFLMPSICNCSPNEKQANQNLKKLCNKCLVEAQTDAESILKKIHEDWQPQYTEKSTYDVSISGPKNRTDKFHSSSIDFDLSLEEPSFVGLEIPYQILNSYQEGNPYSVVEFLFLLIGLDMKTACEYRNDLILDFMTALNCSALMLFIKHKKIFTGPTDNIENKTQKIVSDIYELLYGMPFDLKEDADEFERLVLERRKKGITSASLAEYPHADFLFNLLGMQSYPLKESLSYTFHEILKPYTSNVKKFMTRFRQDYRLHEHSKTDLDDQCLSKDQLEILKPFEAAKNRYFDQFAIIDLPMAELIHQLRDMFQNPFDSRIVVEKKKRRSVYN